MHFVCAHVSKPVSLGAVWKEAGRRGPHCQPPPSLCRSDNSTKAGMQTGNYIHRKKENRLKLPSSYINSSTSVQSMLGFSTGGSTFPGLLFRWRHYRTQKARQALQHGSTPEIKTRLWSQSGNMLHSLKMLLTYCKKKSKGSESDN